VTSELALSIVVPAYNEAARIAGTLERVCEFMNDRGERYEVIVVDDGSSDATGEVVRRTVEGLGAGDNIRLVALARNSGKGAALRRGVAESRGRQVLIMDADLATPIEELDNLRGALARGAAIAAGSRALASSRITRRQSPIRVLLGRAGNLWIRALAVPGIRDTQCGFKLFDGDVAREIFASCREDRFGFDIEVLCRARRERIPIAEVPVVWEHQEGSKVRWRDYLDVLLKVPAIAFSVRRG
jgi:dolichyl-phosphate beta-glucosyltransferase